MEVHTTTIQETADKLAVIDALHRFAAGLDLRDNDLLNSAFAENAISDFRPAGKKAGFEYPVLEGRQNIIEALSDSLNGIITTHSFSNHRVKTDGDKAVVDVLVEAQHVLESEPSRYYMMKNRYDVQLVRQEEAWVIQHVIIDNVWKIGDPAVLAGI